MKKSFWVALADFELDLLSFDVMQDQINDKSFESLQSPFGTAAQSSPSALQQVSHLRKKHASLHRLLLELQGSIQGR